MAARDYHIERIEGLPPQQVTPPPELLERIRRDGALIRAARARDFAGPLFIGGFVWPVVGRISGNYGNQPARRVVSTDREWLHMAIVCVGNHAAIWVNGELVSDFTETRPLARDENGKTGYVPGPGTIHLQGHDPTTDLSFRNIRIQEIGK